MAGQRLLNRVAVVTGAGGAIGSAVVRKFLDEGAKVAVFGRNREALDRLAEIAPARVLVTVGDVLRTADLRPLVDGTTRRFGRVDILVPAAGTARVSPFAESSTDDISEQFAVNFTAAAETVRLFLPELSERSSILFLTSAPQSADRPGLAAYSASKAALRSLAKSLSRELAQRAIRVNCIAPGATTTPIGERIAKVGPTRLRDAEQQTRADPKPPVSADDIAETAVFLASDAGANIRGQEIVVDAGRSA